MLASLTEDQIAQLAYLLVLGGVLTSYMLVASRGRLGQTVRGFVLWALLFTGVAAGYGLWQSARLTLTATQVADGAGVTLARGFAGHFSITLDITGPNGQRVAVPFVIDTGATEMVLTTADAAKLGYAPEDLVFSGRARTANGTTRTAQVRLPAVSLAGHESRQVRALVNEGDLHASLLGMGYLERFARIVIAGDTLRIVF